MVISSKARVIILKRHGTAKMLEAELATHARERYEFDKRCMDWVPLSPKPGEPEPSWRQRAAFEDRRAVVSCVRQSLLELARDDCVKLVAKGAHNEAQALWDKRLKELKAYEQANAAFLPKDGQ